MLRLTPVAWRDFVHRLRELRFEGPYAGGRHPQMRRGDLTIILPNPHDGDIGVPSLARYCGRHLARRMVGRVNASRKAAGQRMGAETVETVAAQSEFDRIAERLHPIFDQQRVRRAIVFGSLARGDMSRRSDLDLIVVMDTDKRFLDRYDALLAPIVRAIPERAVDLLIYTPQELERIAHRFFVATALREGKTIYDSGQRAGGEGTEGRKQ